MIIMEENSKKKQSGLIAWIVAILFGIRFIYKGVKYLQIGYEVRTMGILLLICGVVLIVLSIVMMIRKPKDMDKETKGKEL